LRKELAVEDVRIGVYICQCGSNISAVVKVDDLVDFVAELPGVVVARGHGYMCSGTGQEMIQADIERHDLDRVVVASCTPRMHESTFHRAVEEAGLNRYFFEMANIREHVSWVIEDRQKATQKAFRLIRAAVARVALHAPLEARQEPLTEAALVVGGGIAGIQSALAIADMGYQVYLVEREPSIGGRMAQLNKTFPTLDCST
jgi:heterodisulfide reductase subunit A